MLGRNPGWVTTQGELLADLLSSEGYDVRITSTIPGRIPRLLDTLACLIRWSRSTDVAIVSIFSGRALGIADAATLLLRLMNTPLVLVLHGGAIPEFLRKHPRWMRRVLQRACILVAPSNYLAREARNLGLVAEVLPNVVVIERYRFRKREQARPRLLWMRTFHEAYNPVMAVDVLVDLKRSVPEASLTMAGQEKGQLEAVRKAVQTKGIEESVRIVGFLDNDAKEREFASHDIFLNTNRIDNMPVSLLEAASFGLPIVSTDVGGIADVFVHEETALLVASDDPPTMADAVRRLLSDPDLCAHLSENARRLAESCSWAAVRHRWHDVLTRALSSRKRTSP
jgi:glycosyltransferase involved in cell wall biosynthesis